MVRDAKAVPAILLNGFGQHHTTGEARANAVQVVGVEDEAFGELSPSGSRWWP